MFIREVSDLHLEFGEFDLPVMQEDIDTVLILAGDIGLVCNEAQKTRLLDFLATCNRRFKSVIYVLGNHEHYRYSINLTHETIRAMVSELPRVFVLENQVAILDDVAFIGATLWTDYGHNALNAYTAEQSLNDHRLIQIGEPGSLGYARKFTATDAAAIHQTSKQYLFNQVKLQKEQGRKTVMVVHHGVSYQSVHPMYAESNCNSAFTSALDYDIMEAQPDIIFHGHTHQCFDYNIDNTRVIVNPRGYPHEPNEFNPLLRIEI